MSIFDVFDRISKETPAAKGKVEPLEMELTRLEDRIVRLTRNSGRLGDHWLTPDGRKLYYTFDVSEPINAAGSNPGSTDVEIALEKLPIPKPFYNGSGLHPSVDGWQEVEIGIEL